ncbi:transglycosylase domain-containing protein [Streptomyces sp. NPDC047097]|uniref:transglycosylase domain-containing protein n=1 Tax=Streptomyces sp. NPDC047097 TaxID=3155260 RepID=UPI0033E57E35
MSDMPLSDVPSMPGWQPRDPSLGGPAGGGRAFRTGPSSRRGAARAERRRRRRRSGWRRLLPTWRMLLGALLLGAALLVGGFFLGYHLVAIPPANAAATAQSNVYLYSDGTQITQAGDVNRESVPLARVPRSVQHAVLAAEDRDFYTKPAVDPEAMARAAWNTVTGKGTQGGSTITQQYVKNYYLGQERTLLRKVKEFFISIKLDREKSKDEIFEGYLNTSFYGRNAYGIQAAARAYYGKDVQQLDPAEGGYLATLLNAPSAYDVTAHPANLDKATRRWSYVMDAMVGERWLSRADRADASFPTPYEAEATTGVSGQRGYLVQAVGQYLTERGIVDRETLRQGGFRITTTIQRAKQEALVQAVDNQVMSRLDGSNEADRYLRVGGASVDPATGRVLAMYGGVDYTRQYVNNATRRDYQVGSTFKPFVFAAAVHSGARTQDGERITPETMYDGANKRPVQGWRGKAYAPGNEDDVDHGPISVRTATDRSVNAVYAQLAVDVGPARVEQTAIGLGLPADTPDLNPSPSIALGPATASVLDMAEAYATLANHGRHGEYTLVRKIERLGGGRGGHPAGEEVKLPGSRTRQAVSREAADTTTAMLRSVVQDGTGTAAQAAGRPAAGKTGTAEHDRAAWFAGYTPDLATVVTVMGQDPETGAQKSLYGALGEDRMNGGGTPAQIWGDYTRMALSGTAPREFDLQVAEGMEVRGEDPREDRDPRATGEEAEADEPRGAYRPDGPSANPGAGAGRGPAGRTGGGGAPSGPPGGTSPDTGNDRPRGGTGAGGGTGAWGGTGGGGPHQDAGPATAPGFDPGTGHGPDGGPDAGGGGPLTGIPASTAYRPLAPEGTEGPPAPQ